MEIIEAVKTLYENNSDKVIYTDSYLKVLWKNSNDLPEFLRTDKIMLSRFEPVAFPIKKSTICRYKDEQYELTLKITPMSENGVTVGYLFHCMTEHEVDRLAMQSTLNDRLRKDLDTIRFRAASITTMLSLNKEEMSEAGELFTKFETTSRDRVLGVLSATANYEELSIYLSENVKAEKKFMSVVLDDLAKRIRCRAEKFGYIFECDIQSMIHAEMNVSRFEAAISNLVINSYMYNSKPEKKCSIELRSDGKKIRLTVTDNGNGIPEEKLKRLKKPMDYFTLDDMNESLGLSIVMLYCQRFGGTYDIESKVGEYTKVTLTFDDLGYEMPREFRQYYPPIIFAMDNTGCILSKCFGYYNDDYYKHT